MIDAYGVLRVHAGADFKEIRSAYVKLAKRLHPDQHGGDHEATRRFQEINRAYELLKDPEQRSAYDERLARRRADVQRPWRVMAVSFGVTMAVATAVILVVAPGRHRDPPQVAWQESAVSPALQASSKPGLSPSAGVPLENRAGDPPPDASVMVPDDWSAESMQDSAQGSSRSLQGMTTLPDTAHAPTLLKPSELPPDSAKAEQAKTQAERTTDSSDRSAAFATFVDRVEPGALTERGEKGDIRLQTGAMPDSTYSSTDEPRGWITYRNDRFGFALDYPSDVFATGDEGLGDFVRLFVSRDGEARLLVTAGFNPKGTTPSSYRRSLTRGLYATAHLEYAPLRSTWFVLAGSRGDEMFYERATFACNGRIIHGWRLTYPAARRDYYSKIIERIHERYKHARGEGAHCR